MPRAPGPVGVGAVSTHAHRGLGGRPLRRPRSCGAAAVFQPTPTGVSVGDRSKHGNRHRRPGFQPTPSPLARIDPPLLTRTDPPRGDHTPLPATRPAPHGGGTELPVVDMC